MAVFSNITVHYIALTWDIPYQSPILVKVRLLSGDPFCSLIPAESNLMKLNLSFSSKSPTVWEFCGGLRGNCYPILSAFYIDNCDDFDWCFTLVRSRVVSLWLFNKQEVSMSIRNCWPGPRCSFLSLRKELFHTVLWVLCSGRNSVWPLGKGSGKGLSVAVGLLLRQHLCQTLPTQGSGNRGKKSEITNIQAWMGKESRWYYIFLLN